MTTQHPIFWIIFISVVFWSFYERWDSNRHAYIDHPWRTAAYFIFSSAILAFVYKPVLSFLYFDVDGIFALIGTIFLTFFLYNFLPQFFYAPDKTFSFDHNYLTRLDVRYIPSRLSGIIFQQIFFGSVVSIFLESHLAISSVFYIAVLMFVAAHIPLFILQNKKMGEFYLAWSILGAPLFAFVLLYSHSLWYTISLHMLFYTLLASSVWILSGFKIGKWNNVN